MDIGTLQAEIDRLHEDARSRLNESRRLSDSAQGYRAMGNNGEADAELAQASNLSDEARNLERAAESAEAELKNTLRHIQDIEQKQNDLKARYESEMSALEQEKSRLQGGTGSYSTTLSSLF